MGHASKVNYSFNQPGSRFRDLYNVQGSSKDIAIFGVCVIWVALSDLYDFTELLFCSKLFYMNQIVFILIYH